MQVGRRPHLQFYIWGSAQVGSLTLSCATGSQAKPTVVEGFEPWTKRHLTNEGRLAVIRDYYGTTEGMRQALLDIKPKLHQECFGLPFDVNNFTNEGFLVRLPMGKSAAVLV